MYISFVVAHTLPPMLGVTTTVKRPLFPYRKYILPLFPTLATVNCLPSRPADPPSGIRSDLASSASLFARRFILLSLRVSFCICLFFNKSGDRVPVAFDRGTVESGAALLGTSSPPRYVFDTRLVAVYSPRGERRSLCRCRKLSGARAMASSEA